MYLSGIVTIICLALLAHLTGSVLLVIAVILVGLYLIALPIWWLAYGYSLVASPWRNRWRLPGKRAHKARPAILPETIAPSRKPVKIGHHRLTLRDWRLLPKWPHEKRSLLMGRRKFLAYEEAARLFGPTLRTRNRRLRDLLTDETQLKRLGLPLWKGDADIARALGIGLGHLYRYASYRKRDTTSHYIAFKLPKRGGGERLILAPKRKLKEIQRQLLKLLVERLPQCDSAHGFRTGRSTRTTAEPHAGKEVVVSIDLADFFPSITFPRVRGYLVAMGYSYPVATSLAVLMTGAPMESVCEDGKTYHRATGRRHAVQGAPTSPALCNAIATRLDHRLSGLARKLGFAYTRYADDVTFSGNDATKVGPLLKDARMIVGAEGFSVRESKTRIMRRGQRQEVTGVTVNEGLGLSRTERRRIRAMVHRAQGKGRNPLTPGTPEHRAHVAKLRGHLAYLAMLNAAQAEKLRRRWQPGLG